MQSSALLNMVGQLRCWWWFWFTYSSAFWSFAVTFLLLQEKSAAYISRISDAVERYFRGRFKHYRWRWWEMTSFLPWHPTLNKMVEDIRRLMDKERESERTKNELITNVAHDLQHTV